MKHSYKLGFGLLSLALECIANWILWIYARKVQISRMSDEELETEVASKKTAIDNFVETLPTKIEEIEAAEAEEDEIEKWRQSYLREQANKSENS